MNLFPATLRVRVTREHLMFNYQDVIDCPIARAIKEDNPQLKCYVGPDVVYLWRPNDKQPSPTFKYALRKRDNFKVLLRGSGSLWGKILGGFTVVLKRVDP